MRELNGRQGTRVWSGAPKGSEHCSLLCPPVEALTPGSAVGPLIASVFTGDAGGALASDLHSAVGRPRPPGFLQGRQSGALEPRLLMEKPHPGKGFPGAGNHTQRGSQKHVWGIIGKKGFI